MVRLKMARVFCVVVGLGLTVFIFGRGTSVLAQEPSLVQTSVPDQREAVKQLVKDIHRHAAEGRLAQAIEAALAAFETCPDAAWDRETYGRTLAKTFEWFGKASSSERERLFSKYTARGKRGGKAEDPLSNQLTRWMHDAVPSTSLKSLASKLAIAGWNWQMGNKSLALAQGIAVLQQYPESLAAEFAIMGLVTAQYYGCDRQGIFRTVRTAVKVAPNNRATGWAICRLAFAECSQGRTESITQLCSDVQSQSRDSLAAQVAGEIALIIEYLESSAYEQVFDRLWGIREYCTPVPADDILETLSMRADWARHPMDPAVKHRLDALAGAAKAEADSHPDPQRRGCALLVLGHCANVQGQTSKAVEFYEKAVDTGQPGTAEHGLAQLARLLSDTDPNRAIRCMEQFRDRFGKSTGSEVYLKNLAHLYRKQGRFEEGLALFEELERQSGKGHAMVDIRDERLIAGKVGCLRGLGRHEEADKLAEPLLKQYRYSAALKDLADDDVGNLYPILAEMGRSEEAERCKQELHRRALERTTIKKGRAVGAR